jgi:DNA-binding NarL/FixJ family response regulator
MGTGERTAVIVDHHPLWLDALERLLEQVGINVVGRTTQADEAYELLDQHKPDVFVSEYESLEEVDDSFPLLDHARDVRSDVKCVVLATGSDSNAIATAFANGAEIFCSKTAPPDDLALAVRQAFDRSIHFANSYAPAEPRHSSGHAEVSEANLTRREVEILRLVSEGYSNAQLAKMLWVTEQTVKFHLSNIYRKLDVANRTEAARWAQRHNVLLPEGAPVGNASTSPAAA